MIASLRGTVVSLESNAVVLDVSGVGYLVQVSPNTALTLSLGAQAQLFTALITRDDGFTLFGFSTAGEQQIFDLLRSVTGVGPKSALAILGTLSTDQIAQAVANENDAAFKAVSGIGPKTAKLIVLTLTGKFAPSTAGDSTNLDLSGVISALTGLGWNERLAIDAAASAAKQLGANAQTGELLRTALANLGASKSVGASDE